MHRLSGLCKGIFLLIVLASSGCTTSPDKPLQPEYGLPDDELVMLKVGKIIIVQAINGEPHPGLERVSRGREAYIMIPSGHQKVDIKIKYLGWEGSKYTLEADFRKGRSYFLQTWGEQKDFNFNFEFHLNEAPSGRSVPFRMKPRK